MKKSRPRTAVLDAGTVDVLVVDDDDSFRESLLESIQRLGFVAMAAANGAEALRLARDRSPRLILLDLEMPVINGWRFLERRRSDRRLAKIPVIIVSATAADLAGRGDIDGALEKPIDEEALITLLSDVLSRLPADASRASQTTDASPLILVIEDDEDTQASVVELLQEHGYRVARANNGREAEAFLQGWQRPDCIVLDLWMPVMNGWSFTSGLRQIEGPPIPTLVITAAEPYWGYPVPAAQVMRKPLRPETFLAMMRTLVPRTQANKIGRPR